jgi:iron complex outermembrane recepter protein
MKAVDFQGAVRFADYSGSGGVIAWKAGIDWTLVQGLRLRGTVSRDTRAGTLSERFDQTRRGTTADDPLFDNENYAFSGIEGGDPEVDPEKADTITVGVIYQPTWLQGLSVSVDYYDIKINGAISSLGYQEIIDRCYVDGITELCPRIVRDPASNRITQVLNTFMNVDEARTTGVDAEVIYRTPLSIGAVDGNITARAIVSYVEELSTTVSGSDPLDLAGQTGPGNGAPNYRGTLSLTYGQGPYQFNLTGRYVGPGRYNNTWITGRDITDNHVASKFYTNLRAARKFGSGSGSYEAFLAVTNLANENPDRSPGSAQYNTSLFDTVGRSYTAGFKFEF